MNIQKRKPQFLQTEKKSGGHPKTEMAAWQLLIDRRTFRKFLFRMADALFSNELIIII